MTEIIKFLQDLAANNNREWFNAYKQRYIDCKKRFDELVEDVVIRISQYDETITPMKASECTYRIYRDVRFSQDKSPYKIHLGAFIAPKGKKSGYSGYYFQIGAEEKGFPGGCMIATGDYCCDKRVLEVLREDIVLDEGETFGAALKSAKGFSLDYDNALKRVPNGMPADTPYSQYLRLRNFCLVKDPGFDYMTAPDLAKRLAADFKRTKPFLDLLNRAIDYVRNDMD